MQGLYISIFILLKVSDKDFCKRDKNMILEFLVSTKFIIWKTAQHSDLLCCLSWTDKRILIIDKSEKLIKKSGKSTNEWLRSVTYISNRKTCTGRAAEFLLRRIYFRVTLFTFLNRWVGGFYLSVKESGKPNKLWSIF